jgi:mannose-6-phosphate isomerase-like protein (cupin superfamily)
MQRKLRELDAVQLPNQTNRLALAFSPLQSPPSSFCCGLEVFEPSHKTAPHVHNGAWELFFIISGMMTHILCLLCW